MAAGAATHRSKRHSRQCRRDYADLVAGDRKKKNTDALVIDEPNIIATKMAAFDKFGTDEGKFWLSMSKVDPDGADYAILRKSHNNAVRSMRGVIKFLGKYTELITDPTSSDATSTATTATPQSQRASRAVVVEGTAPPPAVNDMTTGDSMTASTNCGIDGGACIRCDFDGHDGHPPNRNAPRALWLWRARRHSLR
jgi:hypothetical protein